MGQILVVEDNRMFASILKKKIESSLDHKVTAVGTFAEAQELLESDHEFFIGLLDLHLPDAADGKIVDYALGKGLPSIIFTGDYSDDVRDHIWAKKVVDYVVKEGSHNVDYIINLIRRIRANQGIKVLVVDDSFLPRNHIQELLEVHQFQVLEAADGAQALEVLKQHPDIKMVVTDYNMPNMDGFELTKRIRASYNKEEMAIIGMSTYGNHSMSAKFIKNGANDFLNKPFYKEEFYCRVNQNIEMIEHIEQLSNNLIRDYLTGLYNRRYLFETGSKLLSHCERSDMTAAIAMIDLDHFKAINDEYGHYVGDEVLRQLSGMLQRRFRASDIVSRFGGEEFCVMVSNLTPAECKELFESLRQQVAETNFIADGNFLELTVSIGVCMTTHDTLDAMIRKADENLYQAKETGRNKIVSTGP